MSPTNRKKKKSTQTNKQNKPRVWKGTRFQPSVTTSPMGTSRSHHSFVKAVSQVQLAMPEWMLPHGKEIWAQPLPLVELSRTYLAG